MQKTDRLEKLRLSVVDEARSATLALAPMRQRIDRFAAAEAVLGQGNPPFEGEQESREGHESTNGWIEVSIDLVDDNPRNARTIYNPEIVQQRAASIAANGQQVAAPATLNPDIPGRFILIDGHYRKRALLFLGRNTIKLDLRAAMSNLERYKLSYINNRERGDQSALDDALAWDLLLKNGDIKEEKDIETITGLKPAAISKTLSLLKLPQRAIDAIREAPMKFGAAVGYEIFLFSKIIPEEELLALIETVVKEDLSSRDLIELRKRREKGGSRKTKEVSRQYRIMVEGVKVGVIKEWDSGRVSMDIAFSDSTKRTSLVEDLRKRFTFEEEGLKDGVQKN